MSHLSFTLSLFGSDVCGCEQHYINIRIYVAFSAICSSYVVYPNKIESYTFHASVNSLYTQKVCMCKSTSSVNYK